MTLDHLSRALGLAQSLEQPLYGQDFSPGSCAVASEIVQLLTSVREDVLASKEL